MSICDLCSNPTNSHSKVCDECGYDKNKNQISDWNKTRSYFNNLKASGNWIKHVQFVKKLNSIGGGQQAKLTERLNVSKFTISDAITLANGIIKYPELRECKNMSRARNKLKALDQNEINLNKETHFKSEKDLQRYLENNWGKLQFFDDWELQRWGRNAGVVGEMDLLAKHKSEPRWRVIELKIKQSSDETVGQILRYMGWVIENKTNNGEEVEGLIISESTDEKIDYALKCVQNVVNVRVFHFEDGKLVFEKPEIAQAKASIKTMSIEELKELAERVRRKRLERGI